MAEHVPWRSPRPAPELAEIQSHLQMPRGWSWLQAWWPALAWAMVIFTLSTDAFSSDHTAVIFEPVFRWLLPHLSEGQFAHIHHLIRKSAHFTEYFVFYLFLFRGVRRGRRGWRWTWGIAALFFAAGYSVMDEIHQAFVASRTASPYDSLLDSAGAFIAFAALWLWFRWRTPAREAEMETGNIPQG